MLLRKTHFEHFSGRFGVENPAVSIFECAPQIPELVFLKILTYEPKKFSK